MSRIFGLKTPQNDHLSTDISINPDDMSLGSNLEKFNQNTNEKPGRKKDFNKPSTPAPRAFKDRTNVEQPIPNPEFTPLLKSSKKITSALLKRFSGLGRNTQLQSPSLANIDDVTSIDQTNLGDTSHLSDDLTTDISLHNVEPSSALSNKTEKSAVIHRVLLGKAGNAAAMTLKEQEKVLDEIKKENFALKLQIHFLNERMAKMSPEGIDSALKENIDIKVESTTLKTELLKYKKILYDSEMRIEQLENEMLKASGTKCPLTHGMTSEERRMMENAIADKEHYKQELQSVQEKLSEKDKSVLLGKEDDNENIQLKAEIERITAEKKELEYELERKLSSEHHDELVEENADLRTEVERLLVEKRELELELQYKTKALDDKDDEIELLQGNAHFKEDVDKLLVDKRNLEQELERRTNCLREKEAEINCLSNETLLVRTKELERELEGKADVLREKENEIVSNFATFSYSKERLSKNSNKGGVIEKLLADKLKLEKELRLKTEALEEKEDEIELLNEQLNEKSYQGLKEADVDYTHSKVTAGETDCRNSDHTNLVRQISHLKVEVKGITADRDALVQDLKQLKTKFLWEADCGKQSVAEIKFLKTQLETMTRERDSLNDRILHSSTQKQLLDINQDGHPGEKVSFDDEKLDLKRNLSRVESSLKSKESQIEDLRHQLLTHEQDFDYERQTLITEWSAKCKRLEHEKSHLREQLLRSRQREEELSKQTIAYEEKSSELQGKIYMLESQLHDAQAAEEMKRNNFTNQIDHVSSEKEGLCSKITNLTNQLKSLHDKSSSEKRALQREIQKGQHEQSILTSRIEAINTELQQAQAEREEAVQHFAYMQNLSESYHSALSKFIASFGERPNRYLNTTPVDVSQVEYLAKHISKKHQSELRGLVKQIKYLRARFFREETFRHDLAFSKRFFLMQVASFEACNQANLAIIEQMGIFPERGIRNKRPSFRGVSKAVIFIIRTKRLRDEWTVNIQLKQEIALKLAESRRSKICRPLRDVESS